MGAILRRELSSFFKSPVGYVFLAIFYLVAGFGFWLMFQSDSTQLALVFSWLFYAAILFMPLLTMKLFSEEKKNKTDQLMLTSPVSLNGIVYGKFFATFLIYCVGVAITLLYSLIVAAFASPDWMVFFGNLVGLLLLGAAFISIGLLISCLTESQAVAAFMTLVVSLVMLLIDTISSLIDISFITTIVSAISVTNRFSDFTSGIFDISNVLFFVSIVVVLNFITVRILEKRRWS